jgi:hypothetical protein
LTEHESGGQTLIHVPLSRSRIAPDITWLCQGWVLQFDGAKAALLKICSSVTASTGRGKNPRTDRRERIIWSNIRAESEAAEFTYSLSTHFNELAYAANKRRSAQTKTASEEAAYA